MESTLGGPNLSLSIHLIPGAITVEISMGATSGEVAEVAVTELLTQFNGRYNGLWQVLTFNNFSKNVP